MYIANVCTGKDVFADTNGKAVKSIQLNCSVAMKPDEKAQMRASGWERVDYKDGSRGHWAHKFDQKLYDQLNGLKATQAQEREAKKAARAQAKKPAYTQAQLMRMTKAELAAICLAK